MVVVKNPDIRRLLQPRRGDPMSAQGGAKASNTSLGAALGTVGAALGTVGAALTVLATFDGSAPLDGAECAFSG